MQKTLITKLSNYFNGNFLNNSDLTKVIIVIRGKMVAMVKLLIVANTEIIVAGPKTFTVFAPTDSAFESFSKDGAPVWTEEDGPEAAKMIISRHVIPSTLYTAGMRYYLQKDTLRPQSPIHIHKNGGK